MRLLHCADLHIGFEGIGEGIRALTLLIEAVISHQADAMLIAGDLFDKTAPYPEAVRRAAEALSVLRAHNIPVLATDGNHDAADGTAEALRELDRQGLIRLLRPQWDALGAPVLTDCVVQAGGARIVGLGFLGDETRARLHAAADALPPFDGATVCLLHTGVYEEGHVPQGGIVQADVDRCAERIQYLALGHRHGREEHGIAYNPGSPTGVRFFNPDADYGYYLADFCAGSPKITFFSTRNR